MLISKKRIELILARFCVLFPLPVDGVDPDALPEVWFNVLGGCDEAAFDAAALALARRLKRFPFPADFVEQMAPLPSASGAANPFEQSSPEGRVLPETQGADCRVGH